MKRKGKRAVRIEFENKPCAVCGNSSRFRELVVTWDHRINQDVRTVVCEECGLVFLNPGPTETSYLGYYQNIMGADAPPPAREDIIRKKRMLAPVFLRFLKDYLGSLSTRDTVDVGSGWGGFLPYLKPHVKSLASTEMLGCAKAYIEKEFQCHVYSVPRLQDAFPPNSLDLITSTAVVEHYPDPVSAVQDYHRVLKEGGWVFLFTHDVKGMCFSTGVNQYFKFVHPYYYSTNTLQSLLSQAGFANFCNWTYRPDYSVRSVRNPVGIEPGAIFLLAQKISPGRTRPAIIRDDPKELVERFRMAEDVEKDYQRARRVWLSPWMIPARLIAKAFPVRYMDRYASLREQYERKPCLPSSQWLLKRSSG